jgi:hypothetical protein
MKTGSLPLSIGKGVPLMSWLARERLLVFTCDGGDPYCDSTTVHVVNPVKRTEVRTSVLQAGVSQLSKVGDHALAMLAEVSAIELVILDREGAVTHPDTELKGTLNGDLVSSAEIGTGSDSEPGTITRVDPETGATQTRQFPQTPVWVLPRQGGLAIAAFEQLQQYQEIDPRTLETVRAFNTNGDVMTMSKGYLVRGDDGLTAYSLAGKELWNTPVHFAEIAGIGRYVYVQRGLDSADPVLDPNYRLTVYRARTGKRVAKIHGRYVLDTPSWSSSQSLYGPRLDGGYVFIETDD